MRATYRIAGASLRRTFIAFVLAVYAIIAVGSYFAFSAGAGRVSSRYAGKFAVSQGELERNRIISLVDRDLTLARKLADDPEIRAWMENEGDPALERAAKAQLESFRRYFRDGTYFIAIKSSGSYWARTPLTGSPEKAILSPDNPADRWFFAALGAARGEVKDYSLNVDHNELLGENRVWINVIVRDGGGKVLGIAGCGMDLTAFLDALVQHEESGVMTAVVDAKGALMAFRDKDLIARNAEVKRDAEKVDIYSFLDSAEDRELLRSAFDAAGQGGKTGVMTLGVRGLRELCYVSALPELGWYGLVFVEAGRVLGLSDFLPMAAVTLVSLLAVLALVILGMNVLVVAPIRKLTGAAGEVAAGAYDIVLPETPRNEVGHLASSFNSMARKVKEYTEGLESQVAARTAELVEANSRLEAAQTRVMDSIRYARLIQDSSQPARADLDSRLSGHFEILRQRDIVGGDFFYFRPMEDGFCAAVADCTGHGVPGAFMSMMAKTQLDHVVESAGDSTPSEILARLDRLVLESLRSEASFAHLENGLDIALCLFRRSSATMEFAGGGLPLYVWKDGAIEELPGDPVHLGFSGARREKIWTDRRIEVPGGASFFLVSDGVLDLPGGKEGFPFGRSRLRALIASLARLPFPEAGAAALEALDSYRGGFAQRDDICFVGFSPRANHKEA